MHTQGCVWTIEDHVPSKYASVNIYTGNCALMLHVSKTAIVMWRWRIDMSNKDDEKAKMNVLKLALCSDQPANNTKGIGIAAFIQTWNITSIL